MYPTNEKYLNLLLRHGYTKVCSRIEAYELIRKRLKHYKKEVQRGKSIPDYYDLLSIKPGVYYKICHAYNRLPNRTLKTMFVVEFDGECWHHYQA